MAGTPPTSGTPATPGTPGTPGTITKPTVLFAVYGGVRNKVPDDVPTWDVTERLQTAIDKALLPGGPTPRGHVKIDRFSMDGDPANGVDKSFGAIVEYPGGRRVPFAGRERDVIDFSG
jgi:hypothetical protein